MKVNHLLTTDYVDLLGTYLQHMISMFNTYSRVSTHWSLTDAGGATITWCTGAISSFQVKEQSQTALGAILCIQV
jgi:hypothetical protein